MKIDESGVVKFDGASDIPPTAISQASTKFNKTGSWRNAEPYYEDLTPICTSTCPAGTDISMLMALTAERRFKEALEVIWKTNPIPAITGRVCPHPCMKACNRRELGGVLFISQVERFLGDFGIKEELRPKSQTLKNKNVAVVGSGPAGLTSAFFLGLNGYPTTVFESLDVIGGLLKTGIPTFRLPRNIVDESLKIFKELPVEFKTGFHLGKNLTWDDLNKFDAIMLCIGQYKEQEMKIPGEDHPAVWNGLKLLREFFLRGKVDIGDDVIVVGGGNTALDCVRTSMRLGKNAKIVYRRTRNEMPSFEEEILQAEEEGIEFMYLTLPVKVIIENNKITGVECVKMKLGEKDSSGRPRPVPIEGSNFILKADTVVKALGEKPDVKNFESFLKTDWDGFVIDKSFKTSVEKIFASGDCAKGQGTVTSAIGSARKATLNLIAFLEGKPTVETNIVVMRGGSQKVAGINRINKAYFEIIKQNSVKHLHPDERKNNFNEIWSGYTQEQAVAEATRCMVCGNCTYCDNCFIFCTDNAIRKNSDGVGYSIDYNYCKGCGVCVEECPRGAISMREVSV